jgi:hypothetical protein
MRTQRYRAVRRWRGRGTVEADGLDYPVAVELAVVLPVAIDDDGHEVPVGESSWVAECRRLPRTVRGAITLRLDGGSPTAATVRGGLIVGEGMPELPPRLSAADGGGADRGRSRSAGSHRGSAWGGGQR